MEAVAGWSDEVDAILGGDLAVMLAYVTPAGGTVLTPVSTLGLRDREAGTVTFTTSLGLWRKLDRIRRNPRVALAYHTRRHGFATGEQLVLVQGEATFPRAPDREWLEGVIPMWTRFLGAPKSGRLFWDRHLNAYIWVRVPVTVTVRRVSVWADLRASGEPRVEGAERSGPAPSQDPPARGAGPRVSAGRAGRRLERLPHLLLGWTGADGYPDVAPVDVAGTGSDGIELTAARPLPAGRRRAGLTGHSFHPRLVGQEQRVHTGWLQVEDGRALYAPHTHQGYRVPPSETLFYLITGLVSRRGLKRARRAGIFAGV